MDWRIVHGGPGRQHRVATHVVSLVALQCVFCGRRTRRTALVIDRGSFINICNEAISRLFCVIILVYLNVGDWKLIQLSRITTEDEDDDEGVRMRNQYLKESKFEFH